MSESGQTRKVSRSACPQAADVRDDPTEGPGWATFRHFALQMLLLMVASLLRQFAKHRQAVLTH
jgi:hypothetical protein